MAQHGGKAGNTVFYMSVCQQGVLLIDTCDFQMLGINAHTNICEEGNSYCIIFEM